MNIISKYSICLNSFITRTFNTLCTCRILNMLAFFKIFKLIDGINIKISHSLRKINVSNVTHRCNVTAPDGFYYRGTYCESSISGGGSGLCVLYDRCVNATVENPDEADEFCQTNVTTYDIEKVESVDIGKLRERKLNDTITR